MARAAGARHFACRPIRPVGACRHVRPEGIGVGHGGSTPIRLFGSESLAFGDASDYGPPFAIFGRTARLTRAAVAVRNRRALKRRRKCPSSRPRAV
ncbi:hypothetical protein SFOMI_4075 [Sphingobium fuliginis]|uniref:Uncharacterized protein n=1 Tax=Sphingobium fuliginis (strain ATCC 27551) TaxID=336203 RepID=A0A292ZKW3_SPHSA|nr:hypothetical protein SFOMI_4075 [Sphingobium fuliginis]